MRIMVLGSGGREDAIAWSLEWSFGANHDEVFVAPGNGGSSRRIELDVTDVDEVAAACLRESIELVVVGPESALAAGVVDRLVADGVPVFGPTREAARLETSKGHCREFAGRHGIPSPVHRAFTGTEGAAEAKAWADAQAFDIVVKADGLAAGKGVVVPETRAERDEAINRLTSDGGSIVLEERLTGDEVSLLVFTDGTNIRAMPPACDHKRIFEADRGPNTGGMGVYSPTRVCPPSMVERILDEIVRPAVDGLRTAGTPYVGVLYAGVMLTETGPKLIEFNCRFGDPEAQALLPLLRTDLKTIVLACVEGRLDEVDVEWSDRTACTVVLATAGYPAASSTGDVISGIDRACGCDDVWLFHAGTEKVERDGHLVTVTNGGRVLAVTALGDDLHDARRKVYHSVESVGFEGRQFRRDIGWREIARSTGGYAASGVDIDEGNRAVDLMKRKVEATHTADVLGGVGAFGGTLAVSRLLTMHEPVLVASTDGVGTKVMLASEMGRYDSIGHDIVNHCVDDILVQRAYPLFFLDYFASSHISAEVVSSVVSGMAEACAANGCVLLGGETAEMPGVYQRGHFDVAGTMVGYGERSRLLPVEGIGAGDVLIGVASSGLHTNGYSLARRVFAGLPLDVVPEPLDVPLGDALLEPHRSYLPVLRDVLDTDLVKGMAHITGGGFQENIRRVLPEGCAAHVRLNSWPIPPLFRLIREASRLDDHELHRTLNMGIGMVLVVAERDVDAVRARIDEEVWVIGEVVVADHDSPSRTVILG